MDITQKILEIELELDGSEINKQRKRHLVDELNMLTSYHNNHPEKTECPTYFQMYCDLNPDYPECRIYEL